MMADDRFPPLIWKRILLFFLLVLSGIPAVVAQPLQVDIPPSLMLVNYDRMSIGDRQGLEAGAYVARTDDGTANWYNPAGLSRSEKSALNAAGTAYEWSSVSLEGLGEKNSGTRLSTIATYLGAVIGDPVISSDKWRLGFSITTPITWAPGVLDPTFERQTAAGSEVIGYYSELNFSEIIPAVAAGYAPGGPIRFGFSLGGSITNLKQLQATSFRSASASSAVTGGRNFVTDGTALAMLIGGGMQYDFSEAVTFGLRVITPSIRISGTSRIGYQASLFSGTSGADIFFREEEARFDYKYPVEVDAGLSVKFGDASVEGDVKYHGSVSEYAIYSTGTASRSTTIDSNGVPTLSYQPFGEAMNSAKEVVNLAIGGNYSFSSSLSVHAGFRSDISPVVDGKTSLFRKIDLYGGTAGVSLKWAHLAGSIGLAYSTGTSEPTDLTAITGETVTTSVGVSTLQMLLAISYAF
jgi:hypothetical protein